MKMKNLLFHLILFAAFCAGAAAAELPDATAEKLPRWRGFNLLEKFYAKGATPFREENFQLISELGFNFVRLPLDYHCWSRSGDWSQINDDELKDIDQAIAFGKKYGIHVCLNFHRAPGYCVNPPDEPKSLWTDDDALAVCAMHWAHFAARYKGVPNRNLSFDLLNEPPDVKPEIYEHVVRALVGAIRREDPNRLVIADGRAWGNKPCPELAPLHIAQATRGYAPMQISHYKANWVHGESFPIPSWPIMRAVSPLFGPEKKQWNIATVIEGALPAGTLRLRVHEVSNHAKFIVRGDGEKIWERDFTPGKNDPDCKSLDKNKSWPMGTYDRDYTVPLQGGLKILELQITDGDWLDLAELGIASPNQGERTFVFTHEFGKTNGVIRFAGFDAKPAFVTTDIFDASRLRREMIEPWQQLEKQNVGIIVGEWGCFNKTPHDVALRWMEDCLKNWQQAAWGWCVWNFTGAFGPLDSNRGDVNYEDFHGHKLDRKMMELLQKY